MYYEKQILPIDSSGHFLLAIHYPRYRIGGEITHESKQAYFAYGHVDSADKLKDITSLCCVPRDPSQEDFAYLTRIAEGQRELADQYQDSSSSRKHYLQNAWQYGYQAKLAQSESRYVPRTVLSSLNGTLAVGLDIENVSGGGAGVLRFIDIFNESILSDHRENSGPKANAMCHPHAIAIDGKTLLMTERAGFFSNKGIVFIEESIPKLKSVIKVKKPLPIATFYAAQGTWLAVDDEIHLIESGTSKLIKTLPLPKGVISWSAHVALEKQAVAFACEKGEILLLDLISGNVKKYFPHRGCKRDDFATVKVSSNGEWMATKIYRQKELMITRLEDGVSWQVGELSDEMKDEIVDGEFRSQSNIPASFTFIGSRLLVSESRMVRELEFNEPSDKNSLFVSERGKPGARVPIKIPAKANFEKIVKAAKLERLSKDIAQYYSPAVKLKSKKPKKSGWLMPGKKGAPDIAVSRFGGWPDLPKDLDWPTWQSRPMSFLAQINLEEIHASQADLRLPQQGLLLFFLGCSDETYDNDAADCETYMVDPMLGTESTHKDAWKVIFAGPDTSLERTKFQGQPCPDLFAPCLLGISRGGMTLPDENAAAYHNILFSQAERDNYNEVISFLSSEDWQNQLLGFPNLIQFTPPDMQCELAATGNDPFSFPPEGSDEYQNLIKSASEWGLLLQLTSDDNPGFLWGDAGHLYFYGKRKEMEQGDFSSIWVNFEN